MAANRMSMNLLRRFRSKQADSSVGEKPETPRPNLEPTYRTEPKSPFQAHKVEEIIQTSLEGQLKGRSYRPKIATMLCRMITNEIKENVKKLQYDRYRIVVNVVMGQTKEQGVMASSRCAWDDKRDDFAAHTFQAPDFFCTCSVYGVYKE